MARQRRNVAKERYWRRIVRGQVGSGQSIRAFCRGRRLSEPPFYAWRRKLKRRDAAQHGRLSAATEADDKSTDLVAVDVVAAAEAERHLEIIVGGVVIRVREDACLDALGRVMAAASRLRGQALTYAQNRWQALCRYTEDGALSIDNNFSERMVLDAAIGVSGAFSEKRGQTVPLLSFEPEPRSL